MRELEEYFVELSEPLEILKKLEIKEYGSADSTNSIKENIEEIKIRINKIADRIATDMQEAQENVREIEEIYAGDEKRQNNSRRWHTKKWAIGHPPNQCKRKNEHTKTKKRLPAPGRAKHQVPPSSKRHTRLDRVHGLLPGLRRCQTIHPRRNPRNPSTHGSRNRHRRRNRPRNIHERRNKQAQLTISQGCTSLEGNKLTTLHLPQPTTEKE